MNSQLPNGLPSALGIEKLVLGAAILDSRESLPVVVDLLRPSDFSTTAHSAIFATISSMFTNGDAVDYATLGRLLHSTGRLEQVGGLAYVTSLTDGLPRILSIDAYCEKLLECSRVREAVIAFAAGLNRLSAAGANWETIREVQAAVAGLDAESTLRRSGFRPISEVIENAEHGGFQAFLSPPPEELGIEWPLRSLNELTGGFQPGNVTVVGAGTGQGKTTMATQCALHAAAKGHCVAILTPEMTAMEISKKMTAQDAQVCLSDWLRGHPTKAARNQIQTAAWKLSKLPVFIDDRTEVTPSMLDAAICRLSRERKPELLIIDYVQLLDSGIKNDRESRQQHVAFISRSIKKLAKKHSLAVLLLTQLNDDGKVREARDIANDASNLLILNNKGQGSYEVVLQKGRFSAVQRAMLHFDGATGLFSEAPASRRVSTILRQSAKEFSEYSFLENRMRRVC